MSRLAMRVCFVAVARCGLRVFGSISISCIRVARVGCFRLRFLLRVFVGVRFDEFQPRLNTQLPLMLVTSCFHLPTAVARLLSE